MITTKTIEQPNCKYKREPCIYLTKGIRRHLEVIGIRKQRHAQVLLERERIAKGRAKQKANQIKPMTPLEQLDLADEKKEKRQGLLTVIIGLVLVVATFLGFYLWFGR